MIFMSVNFIICILNKTKNLFYLYILNNFYMYFKDRIKENIIFNI